MFNNVEELQVNGGKGGKPWKRMQRQGCALQWGSFMAIFVGPGPERPASHHLADCSVLPGWIPASAAALYCGSLMFCSLMSCVYLLNKQQRLYSSFKCQHHCFTQPLPPVYPQINGGLTCNWSNYCILNNKEGGQKTCIEELLLLLVVPPLWGWR